MKYKGFMGKILRIDLSSRRVREEDFSDALAEKFLGGPGLCTHILCNETSPGTDPLGPENRLIFAAGPLSGTNWPESGRYEVGAKSPLTGILGGANSGGSFGPEIKRVGYDAIVFQGCASEPAYVYVEDRETEIADAKELWGKDTNETMQLIGKERGEPAEVACIGPAGENLVRYAGIVTDRFRIAARSGMGTVMGSKNLKAVALRGTCEKPVNA